MFATEGELEEMADIIDGAEKMEAYPIEAIDMNQFKRDFAETMATVESEEQIRNVRKSDLLKRRRRKQKKIRIPRVRYGQQ